MDSITTSNNSDDSSSVDLPQCLFNKDVYDIYCLIPSLTIIMILAFLNKRVKMKPDVCEGRPGLVLPINFLGGNTNNRLSIAVAFGVIADNCIDLFSAIAGLQLSSFSVVTLHGIGPWEKDHVSFPREYDSLFKVHPYSCVPSCVTVKQRNDTLGNDTWSEIGKHCYVTERVYSFWKIQAVNSVVLVLLYGVINFPIFACLMTDHLLVGAVFGFLYTLMKFIGLMALLLSCPGPYTQEVQDGVLSKAYQQSQLYESIPGLLCHIFLLVRFSLMLYKEIVERCYKSSHSGNEEPSIVVAKEHDVIHVRGLLRKSSNSQRADTRNWFIRQRDKIYKPRPDFKFSTGMASTLSVVLIFIYYMAVALFLSGGELEELAKKARKEINDPHADTNSWDYYQNEIFVKISDILIVSTYFAVIFTSILSVLMILHFMKCHRDHVLLCYRVNDFHGNGPSRLVGRSLSYPGYQIAYVGWGYIILGVIMLLFSFTIGFIIKYVEWSSLKELIKSILPIIVVSVCVWIFQYLLGRLVFRDRRFPDLTINVNNHRLYCVMSFFFFFFNILVGFFSSIFRLLKSMFLGVIFLSRIDRTPLMVGFHKWDQGYMSYIGFLNVLKSYSHPVMLVFCQHLLDQRITDSRPLDNDPFVADTWREPMTFYESTASQGFKRFSISKVAFNRWLVAYTLINNPDLRRLRKGTRNNCIVNVT